MVPKSCSRHALTAGKEPPRPKSRGRRSRGLVAGVLVACLQLGVVGVGTANAANPAVTLTRYSNTVTGNIGSSTAGVAVTVSLVRAGITVDTAPTVVTNASGNWTAVFPSHPPSGGHDVVNVSYGGVGAPANSSYGDPGQFNAPGFDSFIAPASISADGSQGGINCRSFVGSFLLDCTAPTATVMYANGTTATVQGTANQNYFGVFNLAFSPAVGLNDAVMISGTFSGPNGSALVLSEPALLPGTGYDVTAGYGQGGPDPTCSADLITKAVTCGPLALGTYDLVQTSGGATVSTQTATISTQGVAVSATFQLSSVQPGDTLALNVHGAGGRTLTVLHVSALRLDEQQPAAGATATVSGGSCQPLEWFVAGTSGGPPPLCSSSGTAPSLATTALSDELSGGSTAVTMPARVLDTSPLNGEDVSGPTIAAFADLAGADTTPVRLTVTPAAGGANPSVSGNANSATGATITGLVAGNRYRAVWVVNDANGDTVTLATSFVDQASGSGAAGGPGPQGAPGPQGNRGPRGRHGRPGLAWTSMKVCVSRTGRETVRGRARAVTNTTCMWEPIAPGSRVGRVEAKLARNRTVYAIGHATRATSGMRLVLSDLRPVRPGRYTLTLVMVGPNTTTTVRSKITIR
jgi:hypothetical protein